MTNKMFPQTIYRTHENWGSDFYYYNAADMQECIDSLIESGGEDWADISISDCQEHSLIKVLDNEQAVYDGAWITDGYNQNGRNEIVIFAKADDGFEWKKSLDPKSSWDREEMEEMGVEIPFKFRS